MESADNESGACLLMLDFPAGNEVGIDFKSWRVGNRFRGIKGIPPGLHLIYSSVVDKTGQIGFRTGFFAEFDTDSIIVKKWDPHNEWFVDGASTEEDQQRYRDNLPEIVTFLGSYPHDQYSKWIAHSNHITPSIIARVVPDNRINCVPNYVSPASNTEQRREAARRRRESSDSVGESSSNAPEPPANPETKMKFSDIQLRAFPSGSSPSEVSRHMMDKSFSLAALLESYMAQAQSTPPVSMLLGELQLAFVTFLLCCNFEGFEQWKRMCGLLCRCERALSEYPELFETLISVLYHQLGEVPHDFFTDIVSRENFLVDSLHSFFAGVDANDDVPDNLRRRSDGFKHHLLQKFDWDFNEDGEDDLPVVVDTS